ncbi:MAG TPA: hypothetical protein VEV17_07415 [Bryobacteraceae bacterium]|nr:hypothetical protein [Bryobacteraceae bacterium]
MPAIVFDQRVKQLLRPRILRIELNGAGQFSFCAFDLANQRERQAKIESIRRIVREQEHGLIERADSRGGLFRLEVFDPEQRLRPRRGGRVPGERLFKKANCDAMVPGIRGPESLQ